MEPKFTGGDILEGHCEYGGLVRGEVVLVGDEWRFGVTSATDVLPGGWSSVAAWDKQVKIVEPDEITMESCPDCGEEAWDGYICHSCGHKDI